MELKINGEYPYHGQINFKDTRAKCCHLKNWPVKGLCGRCLSVWGSLPPRFLFGWFSNFVVTESGQIQSVKLLQNMVSNRTQHSPPPPSHTLSVYTVLRHRGGGGRVEPERRLQWQQPGRTYQHDWLYLLYLNYDKHLLQSPFTGKFFWMTTVCFGVYLVN